MPLAFLEQITSAIPAIEQIMGAIKGPEKVKQQPMPEAERYAISLLKAIAQPGNSLVKTLAAEELRNLTAAQQGDIRSKVLADRRERGMGRAPIFFDPERADENIAFQLSRGAPMLRQTAQQNAINRLLKAAGVGEYAGAESDRYQNYQTAIGAQKESQASSSPFGRLGQGIGGLQQILDILNKGGGQASNINYAGQGPFPMTTNLPGGNTIQWNQMRY